MQKAPTSHGPVRQSEQGPSPVSSPFRRHGYRWIICGLLFQAYYAWHSGNDLLMRMTEKPGDISVWTPERALGMREPGKKTWGVTYANPVRLSSENNRIYVFSRGDTFRPR